MSPTRRHPSPTTKQKADRELARAAFRYASFVERMIKKGNWSPDANADSPEQQFLSAVRRAREAT